MMRVTRFFRAIFAVLFLAAVPAVGSLGSTGTGIVSTAHAAVVSSIQVRGNQRMEADTIISYLTIRAGERFDNFDIDESVKALFSTGLFSDVSIYQDGRVLVVEVAENSTVNKVFFEGNSRIKDEALEANVQVKSQSIFSDEKAASDVELIKLAYSRVGREEAQVSYEVVPLANNRVNVIYRVNEGGKTKITQIIFIGNNVIPDRRLADLIATKESNFLSFLGTSDVYDPAKIQADEERIRRYYFNRGYADFQLISTTADLDPGTNEYTITFTMEEGPRYTFGNVLIDSSIPGVDGDSLYPLLEVDSGDHYSAKDVEDSIVAITERVAENGFAFVEVVPRGNRNFENNTIDVTFLVDEGARVFIEAIQIVGNDRTRDYVIRREFEISEGDAFNRVLVQKTRRRLEALKFFSSVNIETRPGSQPDRVILFVRVNEEATGDFSISGGYSSNGGASAEVSFTERNFLGRGQFIRVRARASDTEQTYGFNFVEPYFLGYRVSAGIDVSTTESEDTDERAYSVDSNQATLTFGVPITEELHASVFYTIRDSDTRASASLLDPMPAVAPGDGTQGNAAGELSAALAQDLGGWLSSGLGYTLTYTDLDNDKDPREGFRFQLSQTYYGVGGDANYLLSTAQLSAYMPVSEEADIVFFSRIRGGHMEEFGSNGARSLDNFHARGNYVRGFDSFGFGPRDPITDDALGGQTYWSATAEVQFPLPGVPRSFGLRGAVFADAGQIFNLDQRDVNAVIAANPGLTAAQLDELESDSVRASIGGSVIWASPFGPLRLDYAVPIASESFDEIEEFNFGVSSRF